MVLQEIPAIAWLVVAQAGPPPNPTGAWLIQGLTIGGIVLVFYWLLFPGGKNGERAQRNAMIEGA